MTTAFSSRNLNLSNKDKDNSSLLKNKEKSMYHVYYRSDYVDAEKNIPNVFITPAINRSDSVLYPLCILKREKDIPNIFNVDKFQVETIQTSNYMDKFYDYSDLFSLHKPHSSNNDFWEKYSNYTNVFSLSDIQNLEINNSDNLKHEKNNFILNNNKVSPKPSSEKVNESNTTEKCLISKENMSSALCFWCIVTGANVRDHNLKTYFPHKEISSTCIMKDVKLMLINMCSIYFLMDKNTHMYKRNGNISITGLTPEMFESATDPILKCSNLYKTLCSIITKWKKICHDDIIKAFIFAISNVLDDYERTIYAVSDESLLSLVDRLSYITPQLQLLVNICCLKEEGYVITAHETPCGIKLLNKIHGYLYNYQLSWDLFLKMLLYIFESCCLAYFKILSNWALKGILSDKETYMFVQLKPDIEDEDINSRRHWDQFIINEHIEVPVFLQKYKRDILNCGKTINFFNKFNDLNVFSPDITCCFDSVDTQRVYDQFSIYFKYDSNFKPTNCVKKMSNCYLYESIIEHVYPKNNIDSNDNQKENVTNEKKTSVIKTNTILYSNNNSYDLFQIPNWNSVDNVYDFNKPYGFFLNNDDSLAYNDKPFDVINMIDYLPQSLLIPARIQKNVCDKQILDMFFVQENLMGRLFYLSQCFFLMNWKFSSRLCKTLFDGIVSNRQKPMNIFNPVKLKSIVDEAIQDSFSGNKQHNLTLEVTFLPHLNGIIDITDVECVELNYTPEWPMNMMLSNKILLKYRRIFMFANKLEYVSWSLSKARELLSIFKNDIGIQLRKINLFKHWMNQFVSSIQQYYKQVVINTCWLELNENFENTHNYDDLFSSHKQYLHKMLKRCFMIVGLKDKLILLNNIYIEILTYYQALASGKFYKKNSEWLHSEFFAMEQSFSRFVNLRERFYSSVLKTINDNGKHYFVELDNLITVLGPSYNSI